MPDERFLIWSYEHDLWWRARWAGYTRRRDEAGRYTRAEADEILERANGHVRPGRHVREIAIAENDFSPLPVAPIVEANNA